MTKLVTTSKSPFNDSAAYNDKVTLKQYLRNHIGVKVVLGILGSSFCPKFQCRLALTSISSPGKPRGYLKFP